MPSPVPSGCHDIFISYAHQGDTSSRESVAIFVKRLHDELESEFSQRFGRPLNIFFDKEDILNFDHWQVRCHRALRSSRFFIACLSRSYLRSEACRWEWEEWCRFEVEHGLVGQGAASLWFVKLEALDAPEDAELLRRWKGDLLQRFHIQCHEWRQDDPSAFLDSSARAELSRLTQHVAQRLRLLTLDRTRSGNLPWPNANFVGRDPELAALRKVLIESPSSSPAGLHGIGGMGKTALALAFAHHEADAFPGGCWLLRCEGRDNLTGVFRSLVHDLDLTDKLTEEEKRDEALAVKRVLALLRQRGPAFFVLDNVDQPALLAPTQTAFLSAEPWARLLYTTRLAPSEFETAGAVIHPLDVDRLPEDQGLELIRRYQPGQIFAASEDEAAAREIVRLLDGLTLAIETAAVYLGQSDARLAPPEHVVSIRDYVEKLRQDLATGGTEGAASQLREVTATLRPTLARLNAPVRTVLQLCALLGPEAIALPWLRVIAGQKHPELKEAADLQESDPWVHLVRTLIGMRLLSTTPEPRVVTMHRVLHRVLERELRDERLVSQERVDDHIKKRDEELQKTTHWVEARWEVEPLEGLAWLWADTGHPEAAWLCRQTGLGWRGLANYSKAESLLRQALAIDEKLIGQEHPNVALDLFCLAGTLVATGRLVEAEPLLRRAQSIDEKFFGPDHREVAKDIESLANLLAATNRLTEAEQMLSRALAIYEHSSDLEDADLADCLNSMAELLKTRSRATEAEQMYRRSLSIYERTSGKSNLSVANVLNNLAGLLKMSNRLAESVVLYWRALDISEQCLGSEHPQVATVLNNLAQLLQAANRLAEAEPMMRRSLAIHERCYGSEHSIVAGGINNLGQLLRAMSRYEEAEVLLRKALFIADKTVGDDHPFCAYVLNNLATLLRDMNRRTEAEPLMWKAVGILERSYGFDHPTVVAARNNLAVTIGSALPQIPQTEMEQQYWREMVEWQSRRANVIPGAAQASTKGETHTPSGCCGCLFVVGIIVALLIWLLSK